MFFTRHDVASGLLHIYLFVQFPVEELMMGGPISWLSKKQSVVALSTSEAEYVALSLATQEAVWIRVKATDWTERVYQTCDADGRQSGCYSHCQKSGCTCQDEAYWHSISLCSRGFVRRRNWRALLSDEWHARRPSHEAIVEGTVRKSAMGMDTLSI